MSEKLKPCPSEVTLEDWLLISRCVMAFGDNIITDYVTQEMPSMGAARTVGNKFVAISHDLKTIAVLLQKIDDVITGMMTLKKDMGK